MGKFWKGQWENQIEAFYDYDDETRIIVVYVDVRNKEKRQRKIQGLVKGCEPNYRIDVSRTIRIAEPSIFREMEEDDLIGDKLEAKQERKTVEPESATQSKKALWDEVNEAIWQTLEHELSKSFPEASIKITNRHSDYREVTTDTFTAGRNGWIYCTSIAPETEAEEEALWANWGAGYTDWYPIRDRRLFARALGGMMIDQLGPRSAQSELEGETDGIKGGKIWKKSQLIVHGPVDYRDDPYESTEHLGSYERALSAIFIKRRKYENQREYRFVVHSDEELDANENDIILKASLEMLGAVTGT